MLLSGDIPEWSIECDRQHFHCCPYRCIEYYKAGHDHNIEFSIVIRMPRIHKEVQEQIKEEFLPRPDKYKDILNNKLMPDTNESVVVIPCLTKTYGFKTNQYKPNLKYLKGVILEQEFNSFVRKGNQVEIQPMESSKRNS